MADAPERIWAFATHVNATHGYFSPEKTHRHEVEYVRADVAEAEVRRWQANHDTWRAMAKSAEAERDAAQARADALAEKLEKAVGALELIDSMAVHSGGEIHGVTAQHWQIAFDVVQDEARATLAAIKEKKE